MKKYTTKNKISKAETTPDVLTGRGGMVLFVNYLAQTAIYALLEEKFHEMRKSAKGTVLWIIFKQVFCFFYDGTSNHLTHFDKMKADEGYAAVIENSAKEMVSSHSIKRFFQGFAVVTCMPAFRSILKEMFIWRLNIEKPEVIELTIDTMVMDNDEAQKRHGASPTYKNVKGFQPLHVIWKGKIVDAIFRGGKKNGNHGKTVVNVVTDLVKAIRKKYKEDAIIIIKVDSGFFDIVNFEEFDKLNVFFICAGKIYEWTKKAVIDASERNGWRRYENSRQVWEHTEFDYQCDSWDHSYRAIYTRPIYENGQGLLEFARPENVIITSIVLHSATFGNLDDEAQMKLCSDNAVIASYHLRGADELPHRGLKDFGFEQLPFKRFAANTAFYYCMVIAFFLFETFKADVLADVLPIVSYASTIRRTALDFAAKIVRTGGIIVIKVSTSVMNTLHIDKLLNNCRTAAPIRN